MKIVAERHGMHGVVCLCENLDGVRVRIVCYDLLPAIETQVVVLITSRQHFHESALKRTEIGLNVSFHLFLGNNVVDFFTDH